MIARSAPLVAPAGPRYWSVTLDPHGEHGFRFPVYDVASRVRASFSAIVTTAEKGSPKWCMERVRPMCAIIGACWWHRSQALTTALPGSPQEWSDDGVLDYGGRVADELQEAGYTMLDIIHLFNPAMAAVNERLDMLAMVPAQAAFTPAPEGSGTPSP